jgi:hypothetical protein
MFKVLLALFLSSAVSCDAALTLVAREPFVGPGTLTTTAPGSNFSSVSGTINLVRVGPSTSSVPAPGWSADFRTPGSVNVRGTINVSGAAGANGMWGAWVRIKSLPPKGGYLSVLQLFQGSSLAVDFKMDSSGVITLQPLDFNATAPTFISPAIPLNTWVWLAAAWQTQTQAQYPGVIDPYGLRCVSRPLGGTLTTWGSADGLGGLNSTMTAVNVGLQTGGTGPMLRIGCPSLYSTSNLTTDLIYPGDIVAPVEQPNNWYVNPSTGSDNNDGSTPATAWKTADKVTTESQYCGMVDSNAAGPGGGDVMTIDTSAAPLVIDTNTLTFATQGLKVQPASGQTYIKCQAEEFLANTAFTATSGSSKTFQTADTQANVVAWENDKWMTHIRSAAYGSSASVNNVKTYVVTSYATTQAALDANPGSFYTDGTNLYIHPFGDTNPQTDGNTYTRSLNRGLASGGGLGAVAFTAGNYRAIGFYIRKTALVDSGDNDFGAYCFQDGVLGGTGFSSSVEGSYFSYGDKHCFGSTSGVTASSLLVLDTECEQGQPYCGYGGQTPFVSYTGVTTGDVVHTYEGCTCLTRSGLIGSTAGDPNGTGGDIILSHNNGGVNAFASITFNDCNFASGSATIGGSNNLVINNHSQVGYVTTGCTNTTVQQTTFPFQFVNMGTGAANLTVQNCLFKPTFVLSGAPAYFGFSVAGNVTIQGCTFDLSGITGMSYDFQQGIIQRTGLLNLTFEDNTYLVPAGENFPLLYGATSADTLVFDHNAYNLGAGTIIARAYTNGGGTSSNDTYAQWQGLGMDCTNSSLNANLQLQNDIPQTGSPLFNAGIDIGPADDYTGTLYTHRNTIGAYEGSSTYLAPQSISGFPPIQSVSVGNATKVTLPATTVSGLTITYTVISGPATVSGNILTLTAQTPITLLATQAGNSSSAAFSATETLSFMASGVADTPTMPAWGLATLALLLGCAAVRTPRRA